MWRPRGAQHTTHGPITQDTFKCAAMVFIATGCPGWDAALHALAQAAHCPVHVMDRPELCNIITPSIVDREPVAIGTEGTAPVLGREIKTRIEQMLPINLGGLAALAGRLRPEVMAQVPRAGRRALLGVGLQKRPTRCLDPWCRT